VHVLLKSSVNNCLLIGWLTDWVIGYSTAASVGVRSIVMRMSVCLSVCLSVCRPIQYVCPLAYLEIHMAELQ